jgi:hypothetical protein
MVSYRRNGIYRCIIVAAFGWLSLCGANPPAQYTNGHSAAHNTSQTPSAVASPLPRLATSPSDKFAPYGGYNPDPCYKAQSHDAADLCAQWRAAIAAEKAAHEARRTSTWSIVATVLSAIAVFGLIVTIWQTWGALGEARRSNLIAQRGNARATRQAIASKAQTTDALAIASRQTAVAEDAAKRQLRAYLRFDFPIGDRKFLPEEEIVIPVDIVNYGLTPALNCEFKSSANICLANWNWPDDSEAERTGHTAITIHKDTPFRAQISTGVVSEAHLEAICHDAMAYFARAVIFYDDVFNEQHFTQISIEMRSKEIEKGQARVSPKGNIST